jgi:hypothetical protein
VCDMIELLRTHRVPGMDPIIMLTALARFVIRALARARRYCPRGMRGRHNLISKARLDCQSRTPHQHCIPVILELRTGYLQRQTSIMLEPHATMDIRSVYNYYIRKFIYTSTGATPTMDRETVIYNGKVTIRPLETWRLGGVWRSSSHRRETTVRENSPIPGGAWQNVLETASDGPITLCLPLPSRWKRPRHRPWPWCWRRGFSVRRCMIGYD